MSPNHLLAPAWLGHGYDFVNRRHPFGDYLDDPKGAGGQAQGRLAPASPPASPGLRNFLPYALGGVVPTPDWREDERDLALALTVLLDHAREAAWQHNRVHVRNDLLARPTTLPSAYDAHLAWKVAQQAALTQRTLDLFARLEPAALAPVCDLDGRERSAGQAQLVGELFAKLVPGCSVDLGRNFLQGNDWSLLDFSRLRLPFALNLAGNTLDEPVLNQLRATSFRTLRHFHCRTGLVLDQAGLASLVGLLGQQTHLETLELGIEAAPSRVGRRLGARLSQQSQLDLAPLLQLALPSLKALYLTPPQRSPAALTPLNLQNFPRLERLALDVSWPRDIEGLTPFANWKPFVPPSLQLIWLNRNPPQTSKNLLRRCFNKPLEPRQRFADQHDVVWQNYFERTHGFGHNKCFWSLQRAPYGLRPNTGLVAEANAAQGEPWTGATAGPSR